VGWNTRRFCASFVAATSSVAVSACVLPELNNTSSSTASSVAAAVSKPVVVQTSAGLYHTCALFSNGKAKCWGYGNYANLGQETSQQGATAATVGDNMKAVDLGTGRTAKAVATGYYHTCAILDNDTVKCWGSNRYGGLGYGDKVYRSAGDGELGDNLAAVNLGTGRTAKAVTAGLGHTCAILDNDKVKCWGYNGYGQLGLGDTADRGDGPNEMGDNLPYAELGTGRTARAITSGIYQICALLDDNTVKCWGYNSYGGLGYGDTNHRGDAAGEMGDSLPTVSLGTGRTAKALTSHSYGACALLDNDSVKCWGYNYYGQLGQGTANPDHRGDAAGEMGDSLAAINLGTGRTAKEVRSGGYHVCAILDNNTVKCWGYNFGGYLGYGHTNNLGDNTGEMGDALPTIDLGTGRTATKLGGSILSMCAKLDNQSTKCWGSNLNGELALGDTLTRGDQVSDMGDNLPAVNFGTGRTVTAFSTGTSLYVMCALLDNGQVKCAGSNSLGQLGVGRSSSIGDEAGEMAAIPYIDFGTGRTIKTLGTGIYHVCALLDNATVKCFGYGRLGLLGRGDETTRGHAASELGDNLPALDFGTGRSVKHLAVGGYHGCVILDNDTSKCWGYNYYGQLGIGTGDPDHRGDNPNEMGDNLPVLDLGTGRKAKSFHLGRYNTCAILDNDTLKCWGYNWGGGLGLGDSNNRGDNAGEMGDNLPAVDLGTGRKPVTVWTGYQSFCALLDNGALKCWGYNGYGGLGYGDTNNRGDAAGEMGDNLPAVDLGTGRSVQSIGMGLYNTCIAFDDGSVKCAGYNSYGTLGQGDTTHRGGSVGQTIAGLPAVDLGAGVKASQIAMGWYHACALLTTGGFKCWGHNDFGSLGLGDNEPRGDGPGEMGDSLPAFELGT
jgi:alpha-tubulin suppressor-like RCC1 family protein